MKILDLSYATWKSLVQAAGWTTYYKVGPRAGSAIVWAGTVEHPARAFVGSDEHADWDSVFKPTALLVLNEDEAFAEIIKVSLGSRFGESRSGDGTLRTANQNLILGREPFLRTDIGTELMSIDGQAAGAPVNLWNGTGPSDTGADWTASGTGSETTGSNHSGTNGWDTGVTAQNDTTVFDNGSMIDVDGTYDQIDFWINPQAFPVGSRLHVRWRDNADANIGDQLRIDQYAVNMDLDVYQQVSIPTADFNLTGDVQKLRIRYSNAAGQHIFFDDIELVASAGGGPYRFRLAAPDADTVYHLSMGVLLISAPESGWTRDAFANIGSGLSRGLIFRHRRLSTSETLWKFVTKNNLQLFGQYHPQESFLFADSELLVGFMVKPGRAGVRITDDEVLEFVVRDDLSTISEMRAYCHFGVEDVSGA